MRNKKGITLTALTIYVIVFMLVIGIVATLTSYFYNNVINFDETTRSYAEINKFNMFFLQDIKEKGVVIQNFIEVDDGKKIGITLYNSNTFETNIYKFEKNSIYRNGTLVCRNIKDFKFELPYTDSKIINVYIETEGTANFTKTMKYSINS